MLKFSRNNRKLAKLSGYKRGEVVSFSLPSGWTCPAARDCKARYNPVTCKIEESATIKYRCYGAILEAIFNGYRNIVWENFNTIRDIKSATIIATMINQAIPVKAKLIRIHVTGDFYNEIYFKAWLKVVTMNPNRKFYGYTKRIDLLIKYKSKIPENLILTASIGGKYDHLINEYRLKSARVVYTTAEAESLGLTINDNEEIALMGNESFAILIHGMQPNRINKLRKEMK